MNDVRKAIFQKCCTNIISLPKHKLRWGRTNEGSDSAFVRQKREEFPKGCVKPPRHEKSLHPMSDSVTENIITALLLLSKEKKKKKKYSFHYCIKKKKKKRKIMMRNRGSNSIYVLRAVYKFD
ncbi:hypothetical protein MtrunA17_Chr8g0366141 [Medicago truncatula]|uniref:Uncharacterized protein n=1 Tax=Medicago truncatula TaxID=3880 RepID=A0A072TS78_MEDTR|nr:hypothetical protein MTR_8g066158 [Medicago truncatula]RHN41443.1 hypothetical protein MtrunA17_Chr8g0366141 [Medicago truncatula]